MSWGWTPVEENDFAVLYDAGGYWVVEDRTRSDMPVRFQGQTKTLKNIFIDFAEDEEGVWLPVRTYYPKNQFAYKLVLSAYRSLTAVRRREFRKLERLMKAKESASYG
jgi:hypothetical protein